MYRDPVVKLFERKTSVSAERNGVERDWVITSGQFACVLGTLMLLTVRVSQRIGPNP